MYKSVIDYVVQTLSFVSAKVGTGQRVRSFEKTLDKAGIKLSEKKDEFYVSDVTLEHMNKYMGKTPSSMLYRV